MSKDCSHTANAFDAFPNPIGNSSGGGVDPGGGSTRPVPASAGGGGPCLPPDEDTAPASVGLADVEALAEGATGPASVYATCSGGGSGTKKLDNRATIRITKTATTGSAKTRRTR